MGNYLSEPIKDKHTSDGENKGVIYAASEMQGWRTTMEDAHTTELDIKPGLSFFGVFDGHGGANAAKFAKEHLHELVLRNVGDYIEGLTKSYYALDEQLRNDANLKNDPSGCTAITALITPDDRIFVANAGDSRAVLCVKGEAQPMSIDHKPANPDETSRINKAGGFVDGGRVNGNLALSRALGDFEFKNNKSLDPDKQIVTAQPEIKDQKIDDETEFLVLACDGIWDVLSNQEVVSFIRREISRGNDLRIAIENLMDRCLARDSDRGGNGCDNMTVVIIGFLNGRSSQKWYNWITDRYDSKIGPEYVEKEDAQSEQGNPDEDYPLYDSIEDDLAISADATDFPLEEDEIPPLSRPTPLSIDSSSSIASFDTSSEEERYSSMDSGKSDDNRHITNSGRRRTDSTDSEKSDDSTHPFIHKKFNECPTLKKEYPRTRKGPIPQT